MCVEVDHLLKEFSPSVFILEVIKVSVTSHRGCCQHNYSARPIIFADTFVLSSIVFTSGDFIIYTVYYWTFYPFMCHAFNYFNEEFNNNIYVNTQNVNLEFRIYKIPLMS